MKDRMKKLCSVFIIICCGFFLLTGKVICEINLCINKNIPSLRKPNLEVFIPIREKISFKLSNDGEKYVATLSNVPFWLLSGLSFLWILVSANNIFCGKHHR